MRLKKALYNIVTKFLYQIAALASGLIMPRLIISHYGSAYNGTISSITQFLGLISFLTLGVAGATRMSLYRPLADGDILGVSRIMKSTERYMRKVGFALLLYTALLACVYPFISESYIPRIEVALLVIIVAGSTFSKYFFGQTYTYLLQADQSEYIVTVLRTVVTVLDIVIIFVLVNLDVHMLTLRLGLALVGAAAPIAVNICSKRKYKLIKNCEPDSTVLGQRKYAVFHSVANMVHDNTDIFLLTFFTNSFVISVYTVYYGIVRNIKQLMQNFTTGLEGAFGNLWAKGEKRHFANSFKLYEFMTFAFTTVIFTTMGVVIIPFMKLYTAGITDVNYILPRFAFLVVLAEAIFCFRQPYVTIVQAAGKYKDTKNGAIAEAAINLSVSLVFVIFIGLEGVIIGTFIANVIRTLQYMIYSYKHLLTEASALKFVKLLVWSVLNSALSVVLYLFISRYINVGGWFGWIIESCVCFAVSSAITLISAFLVYRSLLKRSLVMFLRMFKRKIKAKG